MVEHADAAGGVEIERKFLVIRAPDGLQSAASTPLRQGYLAVDPQGAVVRLRRDGERLILTLKAGHGMARAEEELLLDRVRFERLWPITEGRRVEKVRYRLPTSGGLTIELDIYLGALEGLITAEVEAPSEQAALAYVPEPWMRLEITDDPRYGNSALAEHGIPQRPVTGEHGLLDGEESARGIVQVALGELDEAIAALRGGEPPAQAVHSARKIFKRLRAIIRVAGPALGDEVRARDNLALRDAGRRLAGARDAKVVVDTLDGMIARIGDELPPGALDPLRALLVADHAQAETAAAQDAGAIDAVLAELATVRADIARWDLGPQATDVLAGGLERLHRKGRRSLRRADRASGEARTELIHELRKRAKDLWHTAELLEVADPAVLGSVAAQAHDLADLIGDDHDLAVLTERAGARSGLLDAASDDALAVLDAAITRRRRKLQRRALRLATELYEQDLRPVGARVQQLP